MSKRTRYMVNLVNSSKYDVITYYLYQYNHIKIRQYYEVGKK